MADNAWPLPAFYFQVKIAGQEVSFREVSGLDMEAQVIEYRHGNSPEFTGTKMPGIRKSGHVTLKKGVFKADSALWAWFNQVKLDKVEPEDIVISLLDEGRNPVMAWTLRNAWPSKITGIDLYANDFEITIEALEIAHEGITVKNG